MDTPVQKNFFAKKKKKKNQNRNIYSSDNILQICGDAEGIGKKILFWISKRFCNENFEFLQYSWLVWGKTTSDLVYDQDF